MSCWSHGRTMVSSPRLGTRIEGEEGHLDTLGFGASGSFSRIQFTQMSGRVLEGEGRQQVDRISGRRVASKLEVWPSGTARKLAICDENLVVLSDEEAWVNQIGCRCGRLPQLC